MVDDLFANGAAASSRPSAGEFEPSAGAAYATRECGECRERRGLITKTQNEANIETYGVTRKRSKDGSFGGPLRNRRLEAERPWPPLAKPSLTGYGHTDASPIWVYTRAQKHGSVFGVAK